MRIPFIAGNWKMNNGLRETEALLKDLKQVLSDVSGVDVAVCPPFPFLKTASEILEGSDISVGAQNMCWEEKGAYTGEVAVQMLQDIGCKFVILGHSERRKYFNEKDELINKKLKLALSSDLNPIVCVGETLEDREAGRTEAVVEKQICGCFNGLIESEMKKVTVAYEPIWAIGTGKTATPDQAQQVHRLIRKWIEDNFSREVAEVIRIQYGGSVKPENAEQLLFLEDIDGALVGGASLKAESFEAIIKSV